MLLLRLWWLQEWVKTSASLEAQRNFLDPFESLQYSKRSLYCQVVLDKSFPTFASTFPPFPCFLPLARRRVPLERSIQIVRAKTAGQSTKTFKQASHGVGRKSIARMYQKIYERGTLLENCKKIVMEAKKA